MNKSSRKNYTPITLITKVYPQLIRRSSNHVKGKTPARSDGKCKKGKGANIDLLQRRYLPICIYIQEDGSGKVW